MRKFNDILRQKKSITYFKDKILRIYVFDNFCENNTYLKYVASLSSNNRTTFENDSIQK